MPKRIWSAIKEFSLDEIKEPIQGKWLSLYEVLYERLLDVVPPQGVAVEFDSLQEAKRAAVGVSKQFKTRHGANFIRTSVREHNNKPCLLVWRGDAWTDATE